MRRHNMLISLCAALIFAAMIAGCSMGPSEVADGGTHTGNPDIQACATALFEIARTGDEWQIESYIDSLQLDPSYIDVHLNENAAEPYQNQLAKAQSAMPADTILIYDTLYQNDYIVNKQLNSDTLDTIIGVDTLVYINQVLQIDTLIAIDTVILVDTVVINASSDDSLPTGAWGNELDGVVLPDLVRTYASYSADAKFNVVPVMYADIVSRSGFYVTPSGASVFMEYADKDGDNLLFKAMPGVMPRALLSERQVSAAGQLYMDVQFEAGADNNFMARSDNAVVSLAHISVSDGDTAQIVSYSGPASSQNPADSAVLDIFRNEPSVMIFSSRARYRIHAGTQLSASADDALSAVQQTIRYRRGDIDEISLTVVPSTPLVRGALMGGASFEAAMTMTDGSITTMAGTVDPASGIVATYTDSRGTRAVSVGLDGQIDLTD